MAFTLTSTVFEHEGTVPSEFTCDGPDKSPELKWQGAPANTKSFVLIMDDPDAPMGTWDHWLLFNIPSEVSQLEENIQRLPKGTVVGKNSWGNNSYGGPCPPRGSHRYFFKLYALSQEIDLPEGANKHQIIDAMKPHVLDHTELMATYERKD